MKRRNKILVFIMLLSILIPALMGASTPVFANSNENSFVAENISQEDVELLASEIEFYFNDVGKLDLNGNYKITNPKLLKQKALSGDEIAQELYNSYFEKVYYRSASDFGMCIIKDYLSPFIDIINGRYWNGFIGAIKSEAWDQAAILLLKVVGKGTTRSNILSLAGQLAWAAYNCRSKL
ncbi:TPA: hypothetical protein ACGO3D_001659 [Streptococcus suis]